MRNLIELRKALALRDSRKVQEIIERIETSGLDEDDTIAAMFKKEVSARYHQFNIFLNINNYVCFFIPCSGDSCSSDVASHQIAGWVC